MRESILRYVQSPRSQDNESARISAARIAADLADSTVIGDLIRLLADGDPRVRAYSAAALERLTGKNQGRPAKAWADDLTDCQPALDAWTDWWRERGGKRL